MKDQGANQLKKKQQKIMTDIKKINKKDTYFCSPFSLASLERINNLINVDVITYLRETIKTGE